MSELQSNLTEAFQTFNAVSAQLIDSYRDLERRVESLGAELALSREQLSDELAEKRRIAERLSRLLEALPAGVIVLDEWGRVSTANTAASNLFDRPLQGRDWAGLRELLHDAGDGTGDLVLPRGIRVALTHREASEQAGTIVLLHDVTEMRSLQDRLHQHRRLTAMGEMAAGLAHQVRTPLAAAMLYMEQLSRDALDQAERLRLSERVGGRLRHIEKLVEDMLIFVRGGSQARCLIASDDLLGAVKRAVETEVAQAGATLELNRRAGEVLLWCHPDALAGAVANIVRNAIEAAGPGGRVQLSLDCEAGDHVTIRVEDDGPGVPAHLAERVFEPFFTTRARGTGLGLAVTREIVRAHGGEVGVQAGQGGCFSISLPARETGLAEISGNQGVIDE